jgi:hypothetical protein
MGRNQEAVVLALLEDVRAGALGGGSLLGALLRIDMAHFDAIGVGTVRSCGGVLRRNLSP